MNDKQSEDLNLLKIFQFLSSKKIFISTLTATFFLFAASIYLLSTISIDKSYNLAITVEKRNKAIIDRNFNDININSLINIENVTEALKNSNLGLDLNEKEILSRIAYIPSGARLTSISKTIMNDNAERLLKKLLINADELSNLTKKIHGNFGNFGDFTYRSDVNTQLNDSNVIKLLNNLILVINDKLNNYMSTYNDITLVKKISIYKWDASTSIKNYDLLNSQTKAQLSFFHINQNDEYIRSLNKNFSTFVRDINLDNLYNTNKLIKQELRAVINQNKFLSDNIRFEDGIMIDELESKVKVVDVILDTIANNTDDNLKFAELENFKSIQSFPNDGVLNQFLDMGNKINFVEFKLSLLREKKELLYQSEIIKNKLIEVGLSTDSNVKSDSPSADDFIYINSTLDQIGKKSVDVSDKINEYIDLIQRDVFGNKNIVAVNHHIYDKSSKINKRDALTLLLIFIISLIFTILISLTYKRKN